MRIAGRLRQAVALAAAFVGAVCASCGVEGSAPLSVGADASTSSESADSIPEAPAAAARIAELRARFRILVRAPEEDLARFPHGGAARHGATMTRPALGAAVGTRFERAAGTDAATHVRAVLPSNALRGVSRPARVALPVHARDEVKLEDETSHLSVRFALENVQNTRVEVAGGMALYRGALDGADVVHRVHAEGTEDFVFFEKRPAREELSYAVDVARVPGLRLVSNTLEFLDEGGTPVLRVAPPYVVDANGARREARLAVSGCAYDASPRAPWGRRVTKPGAQRCVVRVAWGGEVVYPAMVDPAWTATGSMAVLRNHHTASVLPSGRVLVAGGQQFTLTSLASAELFDPGGNAAAGTFAATGSMATPRWGGHTATVLPSGKVLVAGGSQWLGLLLISDAELFDPDGDSAAGTFVATGPMASTHSQHSASLLASGKVLIAGGSEFGPLDSCAEVYDPSGNAGAGTFVGTGPMAIRQRGNTATVLRSGKVLLIGRSTAAAGDPYVAPEINAELYDPDGNVGTGAFAVTGPMATARFEQTASLLPSGKVLVVGGVAVGGTPLSSAEIFDPDANAGVGAFAATGSLAAERENHTASVLTTGKVLIAGGTAPNGQGGNVLATAEVFDPAGNLGTGAFAPTLSMAGARAYHTSSVLLSGRVLVAGGVDSTSTVASAELFVPTTGNSCTASGACLSGPCVDGFCCDKPCNGSCDRCDLPGKEGTCSASPAGDPGAGPACASPLACDGVSVLCPTACASDAACAPDFYCAPDASCQPRKAQAVACNLQANCKVPGCRECASGACADGFCCDAACGGQCEACNLPASVGTCTPVTGAPASGRTACATDGSTCGSAACNGVLRTACVYPTVPCRLASCTNGVASAAALCDGAGSCPETQAMSCGDYACGASACNTTCAADTDCIGSHYCNPSGQCTPKEAAGDLCTASSQCANGTCADGVCCDSACSGQCEACNVSGSVGACTAVTGVPAAGHGACATDGTACGGACNGSVRTGCTFATTSCRAASCASGTLTAAASCDGQGACPPPQTTSCPSGRCAGAACAPEAADAALPDAAVDSGAPPDAAADATAPPDAGLDGEARDAALSDAAPSDAGVDSPADALASDAADEAPRPPSAEDTLLGGGGCACRAAPARQPSDREALLLMMLAVGIALARSRRAARRIRSGAASGRSPRGAGPRRAMLE
jgi:hypothetical protein